MNVALAGGGTGGHVVPGLHLLEHWLLSDAPPRDVVWFGAGRPIEDRVFDGRRELFASLAFERVALALEPEGGGAPSTARLFVRTLPCVLRARRALRRHRSDVLIGLGGYTTLPAVLAARTLGIPVALLEINAVAGRATRVLANGVRRVFHAWPTTVPPGAADGATGDARHTLVGPPLSVAFAAGPPSDAESRDARARLGFDAERPLVLVLGGSQGALGLNRFVAAHARDLVRHGLQVLHQTGPKRLDEAADACEGARAVEYVDDVAEALAAATVVVCRGGASTLAEVAARARPAFVVPYPHHADRHQERNAALLGEGVRIVQESELGAAVVERVARLAGPSGAEERARMSRHLRGAVPTDASARIVAELVRLAAR